MEKLKHLLVVSEQFKSVLKYSSPKSECLAPEKHVKVRAPGTASGNNSQRALGLF